ncbi:RNA polymerase sigma factor [Ruminococcus albus]|uniref:RNA polymerase sigma-70 factor, ECF subfamily n=1 Tax=Ruminococcus albus TaxID=1264 RepID=A0A1I1KMA6_RUMAL|nr:sigma-70 family RNA polymerase sigma factor [Ruminococcus albus]SFC59798.1 RNA polymerase sigma-70 factor, ECF subfamily [Ruminococcus albus]
MEIAYRNYAQTVFEKLRQICFAVYLLAAKPFIRMRSSARSQTAQVQHLREVMDRHGNRILRLAYSYVHNMQDAEEILQDTLIKLLDSAPDFESDEHEKAWLIRVAANLSKNRIEYNKLRDTDELNDELVAEQREDLSFVWEAVKELPDNYREVIHLFYEEGYQTDEIADILGETGANIRTRLKRARAKLKEILKEEYDFGEQV